MRSQIAHKIITRMNQMNFTREDLAYMTGVARATMGYYIRKENISSVYALMAISIALNLPMEYILKDEMDNMRGLIVQRRDEVRQGEKYKKRQQARERWGKWD